MTRKTFLRKLSTKLDVLKEEEKKDILNEYESHIDEKIKKGKTEVEAVEDFGDIDELADEILDAYKIKRNKKNQEKSKFDEFINDFFVTAKEIFKNIANSIGEDTVGFIFKMLLVLLVAWVLKIPFYIIKALGTGIFNSLTFGFIGNILVWIWSFIVEIIYLISLVFVGYSILVKNGKVKDVHDKILEKKKELENNKKKEPEEKVVESEKKEEIKNSVSEKVIVSDKSSPLGIVIKILVILFLIPFILTQFGFAITLGVFITFIFQGIVMWGPIAIMLGLIGINMVLIKLIYSLGFGFNKIKTGLIVNTVISFLLIGFGITALVFDVMSFDYVNEMPENNYEYRTVENDYMLNEELTFSYDYGTVEIIEDNSLGNKIKVQVEYIDELVDVSSIKEDNTLTMTVRDQVIIFRDLKGVYRLFIADLKDKEIHNYLKLFAPHYKIYVNSSNKDKIIIDKLRMNDITIDMDGVYFHMDDGNILIEETD